MRTACPWPWKLHNSRLAQGGAVFGGGKGGGGGTTYQTQQTTIPPEVRARYDAVNARAEQVAQQPFRPYEGQFVAPINATQQAGINQIAQAGQGYQPYQQAATAALTGAAQTALPYYGQAGQSLQQGFQTAQPLLGQAAGNIGQAQAAGAPYTGLATLAGLAGTQAVNPADLQIGRYMDPYLQSVVAPTMQGLYQQQQQQQSQLMGEQAMRGAFGGDRGAIAAANLARQQGLGAAQTQAGLLSQGYQQALQAAQQQQGVGLGAAQANRQAFQQFAPQALAIGQQAFQQPLAAAQAQQGLGQTQFGMGQGMAQGQMGIGQGLLGYGQGVAQGLSGLGQQGLQAGLAGGQALLGAGTLEQQTQQQLNSALYNQYLQQQGYPFQVAQFLANIALGTGPLYGSTTTGVTGQPTPFFSDERVKEDIREIGRTHDGQRIIKFRYKGEPPGTSHIGLSAQDVEKHHPEAVSETPEGIKAVDYDAATKHAERGLVPSSEGGAVHPSMAGLGFAAGGVPVPGANPTTEDMKRGLAPRPMFAAGGAPGVDDYSQQLLQQIANPMAGTLPHGSVSKLPGAPSAWKPGLTVKPRAPLGSNVQFQRPSQQPTGLSQTISAVKSGLGAIEDAEKIGKYGEKAYDWAKDTVGNIRDKMELPGLTRQAAEYAATEGFNPMTARGGRIGYEDGGDVDESPAIPYGGDETPLGKLTSHQVTPAKLETPKLDMSGGKSGGQQKDGTGKAIGSLIGAGLGAFLGPAGAGVGSTLGGMGLGSSLGGMFGGLFARGGEVDPGIMADAKRRIAGIESGGRYDALGPMVGGDRAHGKYQVMGRNIPSWTEEALGRRMTPAEFLASPEAQERVFEHHFGKSLKQYGNLADAASIWHSGRPFAKARAEGARDVNMSTEDYVRKIMGGAPPAEHVMERKGLGAAEPLPSPAAGGLAPAAEFEDMPEVDTAEFRNLDMPKKFATGGLAGRRGYQTGGDPSELEPDVREALGNEIASRTTPMPPDISQGPLPAQSAPPQSQPQPRPAGLVTPPATPDVAMADERTRGNRDLGGYGTPSPGLAPPPKVPGVADDRDLFNRMGDWYERNQNWLLPLVSGIGKTLSSPSPYLGVAIGQGLAEAAPTALAANFKQQGIDINMMNSLSKQINTLAAEAASRGGPGINPELDKAQQAAMTRYYKLSGVNYTPAAYDPQQVRAELERSPFKGVVFTDNPDLLARAANTPGLTNEQRLAYLEASEAAMKRIREKGFARGEGGKLVEFPNYQEAERNALYYRTATEAAGQIRGQLAESRSPAAIAALEAEIRNARTVAAELATTRGPDHPETKAAKQRVLDLTKQLGTGRAFGGRTGYATDGAVEEEEPPVQLAQAYPKGAPLPPMPAPPAIPRTAPPIAPPAAATPSGGPTITITPRPSGGSGADEADRPPADTAPAQSPKTIADYDRLINEFGNVSPPETVQNWRDQRRYLMDMAVDKQRAIDPTTGGVTAVPSAATAERDVKFGEENRKFLSNMPTTLNALETDNAQNQQIAKLLQTYETGAFADPKANIIAYLRSLTGSEFPSTATANPAAKEVMQKIMQDRMSRSLAMAGGNKLNAQVEGLQQSQPEPTKQAEANRKVAAWMTATTNWQRKYVEDYAREADANPFLSPDRFVERWQRDNPLEKFYNEAYRTTAVRGDLPIDNPSKLVVGRHYVAEKNQLGLPNGNEFGVWEYRGRAESGPNKGQLGWKRVQ